MAGLAITVLAVLLDRFAQALAVRSAEAPERDEANRALRHRVMTAAFAMAALLWVAAAIWPEIAPYPQAFRYSTAPYWNDLVLIPIVLLFRVGDFTALIAIVFYAGAPAIHYAAHVSPALIDAGSMLVITALVGARDLGQETYSALAKADVGNGLVARLCVAAFIAIIADRLVSAGALRLKRRMGLAS